MTLLDGDLMTAAAHCTNEAIRTQLKEHAETINSCNNAQQRAAFVQGMHESVFQMVKRPLMEMMLRLAMQHHTN